MGSIHQIFAKAKRESSLNVMFDSYNHGTLNVDVTNEFAAWYKIDGIVRATGRSNRNKNVINVHSVDLDIDIICAPHDENTMANIISRREADLVVILDTQFDGTAASLEPNIDDIFYGQKIGRWVRESAQGRYYILKYKRIGFSTKGGHALGYKDFGYTSTDVMTSATTADRRFQDGVNVHWSINLDGLPFHYVGSGGDDNTGHALFVGLHTTGVTSEASGFRVESKITFSDK
jgi:hypothetical protein